MIYFINIGLIILEGILLLLHSKNKKLFSFLVSFQWILISGLRNICIGEDTANYGDIFYRTISLPWNNILEIFKGFEVKDPGYLIFQKAVGTVTNDYQIYLLIIALIFTIPLGYFIYKNSSEPCISFLIYSCLFYYFFSLTGIRQTIATALAVLIGYKFIKERKFYSFLLIILIAFTIHKSVICFFPFYFIANKRITKKYITIVAIISSGILMLGKYAYSSVAMLVGYEDYIQNNFGGTYTYTLMIVLIGVIALWRGRIILRNNSQSVYLFNALIPAIVLTLMTLENQSFMRVQQYYSVFIMLLVPEVINSFSKKERVIVYYVTVTILLILFMRTKPQYLFFWQG